MGENGEPSYRAVLPVALLHTGSKGVDGATRFQKLVFLGQEEGDFPDFYDYEADKYGPFSPGLHSDIAWAINRGYVHRSTVQNTAGHEKHVFSLTPQGIRYAQELLEHDRLRPLFETAVNLNRYWGEKPLDHLLRYVYNKYDEYTTSTEIDQEQLFDPDTTSPFAEPDEKPDFLGAPPEDVTEVNSSFEDLLPNS